MFSYAPRVSLSYDEIRLAIDAWSPLCTQMVVYEHVADTKVSRTHCHILILNCTLKEEALKRRFKAVYPDLDCKGNEFWKWSSNYGIPDLKFITYMAKGSLVPKYIKNVSSELIDEYKLKWITKEITIKKDKYDEYDEMKKDIIKVFAHNEMHPSLDQVRSWTIKWYWKRDQRLPQVSTYKRNAASLYIYISGHMNGGCLDTPIEEIKNLWY